MRFHFNRVGIYAERYRVEEFPTAEQLAAMGNEVEGIV
jgi:hypothetical protein